MGPKKRPGTNVDPEDGSSHGRTNIRLKRSTAQNKENNDDSKSSSGKSEMAPAAVHDCVFCSQSFATKVELKFHLEKSHLRSGDDFQCCICSLKFAREIVLLLHLQNAHSMDANTSKSIVDQLSSDKPNGDLSQTQDPIKVEDHPIKTIHSNDDDNDDDLPLDIDGNSDSEWIPEPSEVSITINEELVIETTAIQTCSVCQETHKDVSSLQAHHRACHPEVIVCSNCCETFRRTSSLSSHLKRCSAQKEFAPTDFLCKACPEKFESRYLLVQHMKNSHEKDCNLCNKKYLTDKNLQVHKLKAHNIQPEKSFKKESHTCPECNEIFDGVLKFFQHQTNAHGRVPEVSCSRCEMKFGHVKAYIKHKAETHGILPKGHRTITCKICNRNFTRLNNYQRHLERKHEDKDPSKMFPCDLCPKRFSQERILKEHHKIYHDNSPVMSCPVCGVKYARLKMESHLRVVHTAEVSVLCEVCNQVFQNRKYLGQHITRAHKNQPSSAVICHLCGKQLKEQRSLENHIKQVHNLERNFSCDKCEKKFSRRAHLEEHHRAVHDKLALLRCDMCDFTAGYRGMISVHKLRCHSKCLPYKCAQCGKEFINKTIMNKHIKKDHEGVTLKCNECGREFGVKESLDRHLKTVHHLLKPYKCPSCNMTFGLKYSMMRHFKSQHPSRMTEWFGAASKKRKIKKVALTSEESEDIDGDLIMDVD